jgi:signal transduction histidine kinase
LTGRLARLQAGVEQLGQGRLNARVRVEGRDEITALARSFNDSAARIEELVKTHKILLANCSHELRTPLARLSLAIDRLSRGPDPAAHQETARSIAELDALIEEMLLASRLDALKAPERQQEEDLLALAAEEATQFDLEAFGQPVTVTGDAQLLRRMIRNLLDNARRHAGGATRIEVGAERASPRRIASGSSSRFSALPAGPRARAAPGSDSRSCARSPARTAATSATSRCRAAGAGSS